MSDPRFIPTLLLSEGRVVKTTRFDGGHYVGDPINAIAIFSELGADEIVVQDIRASRERRSPPFDLLARMAEECHVPLAYGGGIASMDHVRTVIRSGVEKVIITSATADGMGLITQSAQVFGSQAVVLGIDVRTVEGRPGVFVSSGGVPLSRGPLDHARQGVEAGAGEILLTSIDRDGTWSGYDLDLITEISAGVPVPVIACGGAGQVDDLFKAVAAGARAAAAGSIFLFQGKGRGVLLHYPGRAQMARQPHGSRS